MSFYRIQWEGSALLVSMPCGLSTCPGLVPLEKSLEDHHISVDFGLFQNCDYRNYYANEIDFNVHKSFNSNGLLPNNKFQY